MNYNDYDMPDEVREHYSDMANHFERIELYEMAVYNLAYILIITLFVIVALGWI